MHYFKKNIGDYHKKAGRLSMLQHGAYTLLIDSCYDREKFPTLDEAIDWAWASSRDEIEAVEFVLKKFFTLEEGVFVQDRIREEIEKYHSNAKNNKRIAIDREAKRKEKRTKRANESTNREQVVNEAPRQENEAPPNQELRTINQEPLTKNQEPNSSKTLVTSGDETATPPAVAPKKSTKPKVDFSVFGMTDEMISEVKRIRRQNKGGAITQRVANALAKEFHIAATESGYTFDELLTEWETRGWKAFKAEWIQPKQVAQIAGLSKITQQNIKNLEGGW